MKNSYNKTSSRKLPKNKNVVMDKKYYLERYNKRIRNLQRNFEPIIFVGFDKDKIGEESNYLKIIFKVD
jgi:hypothetical protein